MTIEILDIDNIHKSADAFLPVLEQGNIFAFHGDMGAGKTTFIAALCQRLGVTDHISSPTFSIVNEYQTSSGQPIYHFDCYRIESPSEALDFGAEDYFNSGALCLIEWPENIQPLLPDDTIHVNIDTMPDGSRILSVKEVEK